MKQLIKYSTFEETLKAYNRYILRCAQRTGVDEHIDDIKQAAAIGLFNCYERFDESKGSFHSIAQFYIKKEIIEYLNKNTRTIRIPASALRDPDIHIPTTISTNTPINNEDAGTIEDLLGYVEEDNSIDDAEEAVRSVLRQHLASLSTNYQKIIKLREIEDMSFDQIAEQLNMTRQNASLSYGKAIKKLQGLFGLTPVGHEKRRIHIKKENHHNQS